jgi:hypothetical protein
MCGPDSCEATAEFSINAICQKLSARKKDLDAQQLFLVAWVSSSAAE